MISGSQQRVQKAKSFNNKSKKDSFLKIVIILWLVLILLSQVPFIAENTFDTSFTTDGKTGHYYVERYDTTQAGRIKVLYTTKTNSLKVDCTNIKVLRIYCREMYEDKSEEVFKQDPDLDSNFYKTYFIDRNNFFVTVTTQDMITNLTFIDTPIPYKVMVNGQEWWLTGTNYTYNNDGIVLTKVPSGQTYINIYFKSNNLNSPVASISVDKTVIGLGESLTFDASTSYDPDGQIQQYMWDLGEGSYKTGVTIQHSFSREGNYKIILTVRDNDHLIDRASQEIRVVKRVMSITKSVDKPIATPGSILTYTLTPTINSTWKEGVRDIVIKDVIPDGLEYVDAEPLPELINNTLTWKFGATYDNNQLPKITLQVIVSGNVDNNSIIRNHATLDYKGINYQIFPQEQSNSVITKVNIDTILAPTIKRPVPDVILSEDAPPFHLSLTEYEYDSQDYGADLRWFITNKNESLYIISGERSENDIITITPQSNAFGNSSVTLWLTDSEGYTASQQLWINIIPVNDNPTLSQAPDLIIHYDDPYTFNYESYIQDIDTPLEELQLLTSERIGTLDVSGGSGGSYSESLQTKHTQVDGFKVTYDFPESLVGQQVFVSLIIFDGNSSDSDTIQINITADYTPELTNDLPDIWLEEGEAKFGLFDLDDYFVDPDGDSLFYSFGETYVTVQINEDHSVDISSSTDWHGVDTVTFRARDPIGAIAEDTIYVTVTPINDPPVLTGLPETFIVHYESDYSFDLTPYVSDKDNTHDELSLILSDVYIRTDPLNHLKIIMNYPKELVGLEISVTLIVTDGLASGAQSVKIKVTNYWPPEIRRNLPDVSFFEDELVLDKFNLDNFFSDKDSDTLYYSYGQKYINITINKNHSVDFTADRNWHGVEIVTFRARDSTEAFVESVIKVTVVPVNDPPIIKPLPNQQLKAKQILKFDLTDYIDDIDNNITDLTITAESEKIDVLISGRKLVIYSDEPLIDVIKITISDGSSTTTEPMLIEFQGDTPDASAYEDFLLSILLFMLVIITIFISTTGYVGYRRYFGDYEVDEVFWIYENGILISHVTPKKKIRQADKEIVSGMLTAILDFSEDAFAEIGKDKAGCRIKEIQMDEKNILVERGKYTFLATVFYGRSGKKLYLKSGEVMKNLEGRYDTELIAWDGDCDELVGGNLIIKSILLPKTNEIVANIEDYSEESFETE
jgi:uncharacterized repeat protein (TIGR01451 family)